MKTVEFYNHLLSQPYELDIAMQKEVIQTGNYDLIKRLFERDYAWIYRSLELPSMHMQNTFERCCELSAILRMTNHVHARNLMSTGVREENSFDRVFQRITGVRCDFDLRTQTNIDNVTLHSLISLLQFLTGQTVSFVSKDIELRRIQCDTAGCSINARSNINSDKMPAFNTNITISKEAIDYYTIQLEVATRHNGL